MMRLLSNFAKVIAFPVVALMLVTGCATTRPAPDTRSLTPAQRELRQLNEAFEKTVWEGIGAGVVGGAAIGALAALLAGKNPLYGAAIGGVSGGLLGGVAGSYVAQRQREASSRLGTVQAMRRDVQQKNRQAADAVRVSERVLEEDKKKLALLKKQLRAGKITQQQFDTEQAVIAEDVAEIRATGVSAGEQLDVFRDGADAVAQGAEHAEVAELQADIAALKRQKERLDALAKVGDALTR